MKSQSIYFSIRVLSTIGVLLAIFLLWEQVYRPEFQVCRINSTFNCDAVISGAVSKTLGIPTPLYGLIGYIGIFFAAVSRKKNLVLGLSAGGLAFCLWIAYIELFQLNVICPICIACQLIMISVFSLSLMLQRNK